MLVAHTRNSCLVAFVSTLFYSTGNAQFALRAQSQKELYAKHHNTADGRIRVWFGIRQIMNSTDRLLLETRDTARELKTGIHMVLIFLFSIRDCVMPFDF